jgi:hypothetical protein
MERTNANRCQVSLAAVLLVVGATGHYKLENKQLVVAAPIAQQGKADIFPPQ